MNVQEEVLKAAERIKPLVRETPLEYSPWLSLMGAGRVYLKLENWQITGSFKLRGVMNALKALPDESKEKGLVTASSGNHGNAFGYATQLFGYPGTIVLPETVDAAKAEALRIYGTEVLLHGDDCVKAESYAREWAENHGRPFLSPYNDPLILSGQGTVAVEISRQWAPSGEGKEIDSVLVPVGGGGLISGIAGFFKSQSAHTKIFGCQPVNSAVMYESVRAGRIVDLVSKPTLADGTAGGIEPGAITFDLCRRYVDEYILVEEREIERAIVGLLQSHNILVEGAAALTVAAFIKDLEKFKDQNVVLVLSGARIGLPTLQRVLGMTPIRTDSDREEGFEGMKVEINDQVVDIFTGARVGDALRKYSRAEARLVASGEKEVVDTRGDSVSMDGELSEGDRLYTRGI